jgi:branched-chain amino acid transport system ATP-binding protein
LIPDATGVIVENVCLRVAAGETISIIGRNGVGKTTLLSTVMGRNTLHGGSIRLRGIDIWRLAPHQRVWAGLGHVPQEREIFRSLTLTLVLVEQNSTACA